MRRGADALIQLQNSDGHWVGELEGDTILSSEYVLVHYMLGREVADREELEQCLNFMRRQQNEEGGFSIYPGGPSDVSATVKAYFALKLFGDDPEAPHMVAARTKAQRLGGIKATNTFTKIHLAMLGQVSWDDCPAVPPELVLFPKWFPFNIYQMSSWSRTIVIPLAIIWALKPTRAVPEHLGISELDVPLETAAEYRTVKIEGQSKFWQKFFYSCDRAAKRVEKFTGKMKRRPLRRLAISKAVEWMCQRFENSDGLGAIFPPICSSLIVFKALGRPESDLDYQRAWQSLKELRKNGRADEIRIQPCHSPVWDTAIAVNALGLASRDRHKTSIEHAVKWLLDREVKSFGDWATKVRGIEPGGWYFEYKNEFYPDVDDTIMVMMALKRSGCAEGHPALQRAMTWVRAMQSSDGGWAAFDRDNNRWILTNVPFADHNAMLDPATSDITSRTLEMMGLFGVGMDDPAVKRAIKFIQKDQCPDGTWYGRWGVNYIYGTWQVLRGLAEIGEDMTKPYVQKAADWLESVQNPDGGFGETIGSYEDPSLKGKGPSTPSQTAWAIMGLIGAGRAHRPVVRRAIDYLSMTQLADGTWEEEHWTGTGFPKVFYLRYYLYRLYFPVMAIAMWRDAMELHQPQAGGAVAAPTTTEAAALNS